MAVLCCCASPRSPKTPTPARREPKDKQPTLPTPPPPVRLPGPLTMNPVVLPPPEMSPTSMSSLHPSSIPTTLHPVEPVELGQLVIDDSDSDGDLEPNPHGKSTSTLQLVKTRIRRHLSQESLPRRKGRSAIGTSKQEMDRRAELKRLMHKRIQQELQNDEADAAQSEGSSSHRLVGQAGDLPGGGPRDNLEFSVVEDTSQLGSKNCPSNDESGLGPAQNNNISLSYEENHHPDGRRASCPECNSPTTKGKSLLRERSSLPEMPSSPDLLPKRFPSDSSSSSLGSWRLSYSAGRLDELLNSIDRDISKNPGSVVLPNSPPVKTSTSTSPRLPFSGHSHSLSRSLSSPSRRGTPSNDTSSALDQSPLGTWLRSQGLRSRSPSFSFIRTSEQINEPEVTVQKAEVVYLRRCSSVQNCTLTEADVPRPEIVHLYEMDIHRQLVTRALNTPDPSPSQSESGTNTACVKQPNHDCSGKDNVQKPEALGDLLGNQRGASAGIDAPGATVANSSSAYPSTANSQGPSTGASSSHLPDPSAHWKNSLALLAPGSMWLGDPYKPHGAPRYDRDSDPTTGENSSDSPGVFTQTGPSSPSPVSNASPPPHEDMKSEIVEKSIHHFRLGHGAPAMIVKRFYKRAESPDSPKPSLLARLHLAFPRKAKLGPRSFDGASSIDQRQLASYSLNLATFGETDRPLSRASDRSYRPPCSPNASGSNDSTSELWQRAVRQEARDRNAASREVDGHYRRLSLPDTGLSEKDPGKTDTASLKHHRSSTLDYKDAHCYGNVTITDPTTPISILSVDRANTPSPDKPAPRHDSGSRLDAKSSGFPDAWARFPSHNRTDRNGPAGNADQVITRDFATQNSSSDSSSPAQEAVKRDTQSSIPGRFGKAVKSGFSKLIPSRSSPASRSPKPTSGPLQDIHGKSRGQLVYPELELIPAPGGHREIDALRHEVHHLKEPPQIKCPLPVRQNPGSSGSKVVLSSKISSLLHTDGPSDSDDISTAPSWATPPTYLLPATPGNLDHARIQRGTHSTTTTTGATDRFATPASAMSLGNSNENTSSSSFHSVPQSSPVSRGVRSHLPCAGADMYHQSELNRSSDSISVKSDTAMPFVRKMQQQLLTLSGGSHVSGNAGYEANSPAKFKTWSARRSKTHPVLPVAHTTTPDGAVGRVWQSSLSLETKVAVH